MGRMHARTNNLSPRAEISAVLLIHELVILSRYMIPITELIKRRRCHAAFIDALGISSAHLLGNSYGCQLCAEFAVRYPERVQRLILQVPTVNPHKPSFWGQLQPWPKDSRNEPFSLGLIMSFRPIINDFVDTGILPLH